MPSLVQVGKSNIAPSLVCLAGRWGAYVWLGRIPGENEKGRVKWITI